MAEKETFFLIYSRMEYAFQTKTRLSDLSLMAQRAQLLYKLLYLRFQIIRIPGTDNPIDLICHRNLHQAGILRTVKIGVRKKERILLLPE